MSRYLVGEIPPEDLDARITALENAPAATANYRLVEGVDYVLGAGITETQPTHVGFNLIYDGIGVCLFGALSGPAPVFAGYPLITWLKPEWYDSYDSPTGLAYNAIGFFLNYGQSSASILSVSLWPISPDMILFAEGVEPGEGIDIWFSGQRHIPRATEGKL